MMLSWKIRYLDRADKQFKDRDLFLDTKTLDPVTRAAVELVVEGKSSKTERDVLRFRHLFHEGEFPWHGDGPLPWDGLQMLCLSDYFEDETGKEISLQEMGPILTGSPTAMLIPRGAKQHDIDLMLAEPKPVPLAGVPLNQDDLRLLGYFVRDLSELMGSAFMKDGPGKITAAGTGRIATPIGGDPVLETAVTDDEIRSFVTIFRRFYMEKEPANFKKAVAAYATALGDHPYAAWVAGVAREYESRLTATPEFRPFLQPGTCTFTTKRLIDVFLYTQYAHQPDEKRQQQFGDCLSQVHGKRSLLTWMFLTEIWKCGLEIGNAGRVIAAWFKHYCDHHGLSPDVLTSLRHDHQGIGAAEKADARQARLFREKAEELAMELWKQHGRPEGSPTQFLPMARAELMRATQGG